MNQPRTAENSGGVARGDAGTAGNNRRAHAPTRAAICRSRHANPIEYEGTYPLPEAQLDRFLIRMRVGYPSADGEWEMLERRLERREDEP
jgi:MoxR-like ATPase